MSENDIGLLIALANEFIDFLGLFEDEETIQRREETQEALDQLLERNKYF